ncbi:MAG: hypothetical protein QOH35_3971 [Acidobacteriaceae bacterium]|nr:hypothetical protein [Acidobacteriaceae bacterium]MEA2542605.1 hypothetical protein [Acidobacteriaceae bacterium]
MPGFSSLCALGLPIKPPQGTRGAGARCNDRIAGFHSCRDRRGELHPCFIPQSTVYAPGSQPVYTHCMRRIAAIALLCVFATLLPAATALALTAPEQLLPICCRAHGAHACVMGSMASASPDAGPLLRQPACPYNQSPRAVTNGSITADFTARTRFGLVIVSLDRQLMADAVATRMLRRSAPRGPPLSFSV